MLLQETAHWHDSSSGSFGTPLNALVITKAAVRVLNGKQEVMPFFPAA
jgi:hypothetical protein